jgi:hypothetical protein
MHLLSLQCFPTLHKPTVRPPLLKPSRLPPLPVHLLSLQCFPTLHKSAVRPPLLIPSRLNLLIRPPLLTLSQLTPLLLGPLLPPHFKLMSEQIRPMMRISEALSNLSRTSLTSEITLARGCSTPESWRCKRGVSGSEPSCRKLLYLFPSNSPAWGHFHFHQALLRFLLSLHLCSFRQQMNPTRLTPLLFV